MATVEEVKKLAMLARIAIAEEDVLKFTNEFDAILAYVGQLETLDLSDSTTDAKPPLRNSMRIDGDPHAPGVYTETLAAQFPDREDDALSVKQIVQHD